MPFDRGNDAGYIATIQVGTPPRDFSVLMDSGSGDFWVGGEGCKTDVGGTCVCIISSRFIQLRSVLMLCYLPGQSPFSWQPFFVHFPRHRKTVAPRTRFRFRLREYRHRQRQHRRSGFEQTYLWCILYRNRRYRQQFYFQI